MLAIEEIHARLQDRRIDIVAESSGVGYSTVRDIRSGENKNPTYETIKKLSEYFEMRAGSAGAER